jgi:hypothetical protein
MRWSRILTLFLPADDKRFQVAPSPIWVIRDRADASGKTPVKPSAQKDFTFPNFGFVTYSTDPGPAKGALAIVTTCGPGGGGRGSDGAGSVMTGRATVSPHATRYDTALESGLVDCQG